MKILCIYKIEKIVKIEGYRGWEMFTEIEIAFIEGSLWCRHLGILPCKKRHFN